MADPKWKVTHVKAVDVRWRAANTPAAKAKAVAAVVAKKATGKK